MTFDLIIVGGGPAGVAAGVYAGRKKLRTLFLTYDFGGQSVVSAEIQNWIGTPAISGEALARQLETHLRAYEGEGLSIKTRVKVQAVVASGKNFTVTAESGEKFESRAVLIATGATRRKLIVPGAAEFEQKGITYCATCDGPLFAGQDVAVIGGGNAALETAAQLLAYCRTVTLLNRSGNLRADAVTVEKVKAKTNFKLLLNAEPAEFRGDPSTTSGQANFVKELIYLDKATGEKKSLAVGGVFVEIGLVPTTAMVKDLVKLNQYNQIVVDPRTQAASIAGVWAAGDCADGLYHQNNIAAGDAVKALEDIYNHLHLKT